MTQLRRYQRNFRPPLGARSLIPPYRRAGVAATGERHLAILDAIEIANLIGKEITTHQPPPRIVFGNECAICIDVVEAGQEELTTCGHPFH